MKLFTFTRRFPLRLATALKLGVALLATSLIYAEARSTSGSASPDRRYEDLLGLQERSALPRKARMQTAQGTEAPRPKHPAGSQEKARAVAEFGHVFGDPPKVSRRHRSLCVVSRACSWSWSSRAPPEFVS